MTETFEQAWGRMEAKGYKYGRDALEQVRFGWELAMEAMSSVAYQQPIKTAQVSLDILNSELRHDPDDILVRVSIAPVAYEFYNPMTGHSIVDYTQWTHVGHLTEQKGYQARPLVYSEPAVRGTKYEN